MAEFQVLERTTESGGWLGRNVVGTTATSFLSDVEHERATSILPAFLAPPGIAPSALALIAGAVLRVR